MSAVVKIIPKADRLSIVAEYDHKTVHYEGNIFKFIENLMESGWVGKGSFTANSGSVYGLTFEFREKAIDESGK